MAVRIAATAAAAAEQAKTATAEAAQRRSDVEEQDSIGAAAQTPASRGLYAVRSPLLSLIGQLNNASPSQSLCQET